MARRYIAAFWNGVDLDLRFGAPLIYWGVLSVLMVATGPFGTQSALGILGRMVLWLPVLAMSGLIGWLTHLSITALLPRLGVRCTVVLVVAVATAIVLPLLAGLIAAVCPVAVGQSSVTAEMAMLVVALLLGQSALRLVECAPIPEAVVQDAIAAQPEPVARLLQRIEAAAQGELWSVSVRDHYVDVTTSLGTRSLLMRFADAIAETEPVAGAQVHRSHWVAWAAVAAVEREAGRMFLLLHNGTRVPVSKNHRAKVDGRRQG